jgi:hypothetical protein
MIEIEGNKKKNKKKKNNRSNDYDNHNVTYSKEDLIKAITSNNTSMVRKITPKLDTTNFDSDLLKLALESDNSKIFNLIASKTNIKYFDESILKLSLKLNNADIVRNIVDRIEDYKLLVKYKDKIQKCILREKDVLNLTGQILSRLNNNSFDREMQELVLDIYLDTIKSSYNKGNIPNNFPINQFEESIKASREFFSHQHKINFDSLVNSDRFLIVPILAEGHAFSAVVRKIVEPNQEDKISITLVNLGYRPFEVGTERFQYKEYVFKPEDAITVLKQHSYNIRLYYPQRAVSTPQVYRNFKKLSIEDYTINVTSRDQKVGNCFTKNIEKGVRYALALGLSKVSDKGFDPKDLRFVQGQDKSKVKFLRPIFSVKDKSKDKANKSYLTTLQLKQELISSLTEKFPEYQGAIMKEWNLYKTRKESMVKDDRKCFIDDHIVDKEIGRVGLKFDIFEMKKIYRGRTFDYAKMAY